VRRVVATPHLPASRVDGPFRPKARAAFRELRERARVRLDGLRLTLAYEVRLDDPDADLAEPELVLGDGDALLVEFSGFRVPEDPEGWFEAIRGAGRTPVLAHPERYRCIGEAYGRLVDWRSAGVRTCVNVGSLWGRHGRRAAGVARRMLAEGHIDLLATDNHSRPGRADSLRPIWDLLSGDGHGRAASLLALAAWVAVPTVRSFAFSPPGSPAALAWSR
jgi:protein-tyrosine phosphatase